VKSYLEPQHVRSCALDIHLGHACAHSVDARMRARSAGLLWSANPACVPRPRHWAWFSISDLRLHRRPRFPCPPLSVHPPRSLRCSESLRVRNSHQSRSRSRSRSWALTSSVAS